MTQVLVTGCAGYLGPVIVRRLKQAGHRVIGIDLGWYTSQHVEVPEWPHTMFFGDIRDGTGAIAPVVVHLAGLSNDPLGHLSPALTKSINEDGTLHLIRTMKRSRHVVVSSCAVYGYSDEVADETTAPNPLTEYARAKANVDAAIADNPMAVSLRLGTVYGPSPGHRLDLVVNRMAYDAVHGLGIKAHGSQWRPFVHIDDVAEAVARAVESDITGIRNVVGQNMRIDTLSSVVAVATGASRTVGDSPDKRDYRAVSVDREWMADHTFRTISGSIVELADYSRTLPGLPSRYERLRTIQTLIERGRLTVDLKEPIAA